MNNELLDNYEFGKTYTDEIPVEEADKYAELFGEGSKALTELIKYCIVNNIVTLASCKGHPEERDIITRSMETGYISFRFERDYDEEDFAYFLASVPTTKNQIKALVDYDYSAGRVITFYVPARVKGESEAYFTHILNQLKKYKEMKENNELVINQEQKEIVDYMFNYGEAYEMFTITQSSYKKYERNGSSVKRVSKCSANNITGNLHGKFGTYLQKLREKKIDDLINSHRR